MSGLRLRSLAVAALTIGVASFVLASPVGPTETGTGLVSGRFSMTPKSGPATSTKAAPARAAATATRKTPTTPTTKPPARTTPRPQRAKPTSLGDRQWEMVPLPALPPYTDASIKNSTRSTHPLKVCRDWDKTSCRRGSPSGELKPGESSNVKFGWDDTDGFRRNDRWVKEHGCFGCVVTVTVR